MGLLRAMKISILVFFVISQHLNKANGRCLTKSAKGNCSAGWSKWKNHCYKGIESLQWDAAKNNCIEIGGWMATPKSQEEQSHLWNLAAAEIWIDCNDIQEEDTWVCKDGATDVDYRNWASLEPDNGRYQSGSNPAENCGKMWKSAWGDVNCNTNSKTRLPAVCKQSMA